MTTKQEVIEELKTELAMRRRVWGEIPGSPGQFVKAEHTRRYGALADLLATLEAMRSAEYQIFTNRADRLKQEAEAQGKLF